MYRRQLHRNLRNRESESIHRVSLLALTGAALALSACGSESDVTVATTTAEQACHRAAPTPNGCGFTTKTQHFSSRHGGYTGTITLTNSSGAKATEFEILADLGGATVRRCLHAECEATDGGYLISEPSHFSRSGIKPGHRYVVGFRSPDQYAGLTPYIISVNGQKCDADAPEITLEANGTFFTAEGTLSLTATATDNVAVLKVVFERDGVAVATDTEAPYSLEIPISDVENGRHTYSAVAYDPTGNSTASTPVRVLTGIGNKFFGSVAANAADYTHLLAHFDQLTPGNSGKWGSVEATRDQMNWDSLDTAYAFARENGLRFKLHTLVWGQQQPGWIDALPADEQLAEIDQWMAAAAERYPDVDMVDVVNEPLHAVPGYSEALGGAGVTGWDWVIKSFEMARKYFPKAELLINEYNVEALGGSTTDYLAIIGLLQERGLIDGIGLQAHFLERADLSLVSANVDRIAATGLPIYVSELDLDFSNDARQAQRMRDLFTLFWQNPSVLGVTHWGHLQGSMWRTDAYLIRTDGTNRPALDWIECYRAGGTDCPVPEYVPDPRTGDIGGIKLEAEDYDDAAGVVAAGDGVGYADNDDWLTFSRVVFDSNWDTISVTYGKGTQESGSVSIHLDSLDSPALATIPLEPTDTWAMTTTVSVPFLPLAGEHNVFVRYHGGSGVGNIDNFQIGAPDGLGRNVVANSDFEANADGWYTWDGVLSTSDQLAVSGNRSLLLSGRSGNGPIATNLTGAVVPGKTYQLSLWTTIAGAATANINLTQKIVCDGQAAYTWFVNPTAVQQGEWTELTGSLVVPDCNLSEAVIWAEGPAGGVDIYLDHVSLRTPASSNVVNNGTFESGIAGWFTWGGTASATTARAHSGNQSLLIGDRTGNAPAAIDLTSSVTRGSSYPVSFWVSIGGAATANVNLTQAVSCDGSAAYSWLSNPVAVADGDWVQLKGTLNVPDCNLTQLLVWAEGPGAGVDLYVDDVSVLVPSATNLLPDGTFESSTGSWYSWDGTLSTTSTRAHGGSQSLMLGNRSGNGPVAHSLMGLVTPGKTYSITFFTSIGGAATANANITQAAGCDGAVAYNWLTAPAPIADGEWVKLSGTVDVPDCNLTSMDVWIEGPPGGVDIYVDDVTLTP